MEWGRRGRFGPAVRETACAWLRTRHISGPLTTRSLFELVEYPDEHKHRPGFGPQHSAGNWQAIRTRKASRWKFTALRFFTLAGGDYSSHTLVPPAPEDQMLPGSPSVL